MNLPFLFVKSPIFQDHGLTIPGEYREATFRRLMVLATALSGSQYIPPALLEVAEFVH